MRELKNSEVDFVSGGGPPPPEFPGITDPEILRSLNSAYGNVDNGGMGHPAMGFGGPEGETETSPNEWTAEDIEYARDVLENPNDYERGDVAWAQEVVDTDNLHGGIINGAIIGAAFGPVGIIQGIYAGIIFS